MVLHFGVSNVSDVIVLDVKNIKNQKKDNVFDYFAWKYCIRVGWTWETSLKILAERGLKMIVLGDFVTMTHACFGSIF